MLITPILLYQQGFRRKKDMHTDKKEMEEMPGSKARGCVIPTLQSWDTTGAARDLDGSSLEMLP